MSASMSWKVMPESAVVAQKILSCIARLQQRFGIGHVIEVLTGANTEQVRSFGHETLSTYGLLREMDEKSIRNLVFQLIDQGLLDRTPGDRADSQVERCIGGRVEGSARCALDRNRRRRRPRKPVWRRPPGKNVDRELFEHLRELRKAMATERKVPAYVIMGDQTLRELASVRPGSLGGFRQIRGIGDQKLKDLGPTFVDAIRLYCQSHDLSMDQSNAEPPHVVAVRRLRQSNRASPREG
jgi:ATP-dependent DNA helicase RecQ